MILLDGKKTANDIAKRIAIEVSFLLSNGGKKPHLAGLLTSYAFGKLSGIITDSKITLFKSLAFKCDIILRFPICSVLLNSGFPNTISDFSFLSFSVILLNTFI